MLKQLSVKNFKKWGRKNDSDRNEGSNKVIKYG